MRSCIINVNVHRAFATMPDNRSELLPQLQQICTLKIQHLPCPFATFYGRTSDQTALEAQMAVSIHLYLSLFRIDTRNGPMNAKTPVSALSGEVSVVGREEEGRWMLDVVRMGAYKTRSIKNWRATAWLILQTEDDDPPILPV